MEMDNTRYKELDALRGVAALMVVLFHLTMVVPSYNMFLKFGKTGVDLFFILSGFVIFMSLQKVATGKDFIINRVSRLYPTYWTSVIFSFLIIISYSLYKGNPNLKNDFIDFVGNMTMFQFYLGIPDLDLPYWTLLVEMLFYISILFLFQLNILKYINAIGICCCAVVVILTQAYHNVFAVQQLLYWIPLLRFIPLFLAGIVFYKIYTGQTGYYGYAIILFCLCCQISFFPYINGLTDYLTQTEYGLVLFTYFTLFTLFINKKLMFIVNGPTLFLGKISYALYLTHQYISLNFIIPFLVSKSHLDFWIIAFFIDLPIVIGIATLITYKIEIPLGKKLKAKLQTMRITS